MNYIRISCDLRNILYHISRRLPTGRRSRTRRRSRASGREAAARQYPLPGIGSPDELAELIVWLLSQHAARVTGQVWSIDGGFCSIRPLIK